ncbi:MAG: universal stress protein [Nitrosomonas sp.]|nr:universal stress protein [Nitrosomonas sp.]
MLKFLLPTDGSENACKAIRKAIEMMDWYKTEPELHLLNVQRPLDGNIALFINQNDIKQYHHEEGMKCLQKPFSILDQSGKQYKHHITIGDPAEQIERFAEELHCELIIISARGHGAIKNLLLGSVVNKVMQYASKPVLLVK